MTVLQTDEFGRCLTEAQARRYLSRWGVSTVSVRGALVFRYPGQDARKVLPVFIQGKGWFYPEHELAKDYVKAEGEPALSDSALPT